MFQHNTASPKAVFFDRDGVLIEERWPLLSADEIHLSPGVGEALARLKAAGFLLMVVSNQAVVARGMITLSQLDEIHAELGRRLTLAGSPPLDAIYACPHHPEATLPAYRVECDCRKPRPGSLLRAAREHNLDLAGSFMVGDRITDVLAGSRAGCRTVLIESPATAEPPIVTLEPIDETVRPDYVCRDLAAAADWILCSHNR
jgi:D-glycero-D-manno-heptose 1,7-bisphosphate phosphatase